MSHYFQSYTKYINIFVGMLRQDGSLFLYQTKEKVITVMHSFITFFFSISTFAWYQANNQASVKGSAANATLATSTTSLAAGAYTLNFHIYSGASGTSTSFSVQLSNNNAGQLERGIYNSSGSAIQKENVAAGGTTYGQTAENANGSAVYHTTDEISIASVNPLAFA